MSTAETEPVPTPRGWIVPLLVGGVAAMLALMDGGARSGLRFERAAILHGDLWRLLTGNLVHLGPGHLALNLAGLALVAALAREVMPPTRVALTLLGAMLGVGLGLLWFAPDVGWYVGLSGALHGLLAWTACELLVRIHTRWLGALLTTMLVIKLAHELTVGPFAATAALAGGPVIVEAHLYGALGGVFAGLLARGVARVRRTTQV